jgi:hypothetical protein
MASRLLSIIRSYKPSDGQSRGSNKTSLKTTPSPPVTSLDSLRSSPFQQSQQLMTLQQQQQHRNNIKYRTVVSHQCSHRWPPPPLRYYHLRFHLILRSVVLITPMGFPFLINTCGSVHTWCSGDVSSSFILKLPPSNTPYRPWRLLRHYHCHL